MSSATGYRSVPTTRTRTKGRREKIFDGLIILIVSVGIGASCIIFGILRYNQATNFSTQPSSCRVNAIETERLSERSSSSVSAVWNVDIVKQSQGNNTTKDLVVLRPGLKIKGYRDYKFDSLALEDAERQYSIGKIYPCYVHKQLLGDAANDSEEINRKYPILWEKTLIKFSMRLSIMLLSVGSLLIVMGIITALIAISTGS